MVKVLIYMTYWGKQRELILFNLVEWLLKGDPAEAYSYLNRNYKDDGATPGAGKLYSKGKESCAAAWKVLTGKPLDEWHGTGMVSQRPWDLHPWRFSRLS